MAYNNEDILVLAKAGFTAEQIAALNSVQAPQPEQPTPPAPAPTAPAAVAPAPVAPEAVAPTTAAPHTVEDVLSAITNLSTNIQNANLINAQMPLQEQKTAESILASIINPPVKKEE